MKRFIPMRYGCAFSVAILLLMLLNGCMPLPKSTTYFQHHLATVVAGHQYEFDRYYKCEDFLDFSEADGQLHHRWHLDGWEASTVALPDNRVLVFPTASGGCQSDYQEIHAPSDRSSAGDILGNAVRLLDSASNPTKLYLLPRAATSSPTEVKTEWTKRIQHPAGEIGPLQTDELLKAQIRKHQHGFQRVTVHTIPFEEWATTPAARQYFGQFHSIAIARGDAGSFENQAIRFPFFKERIARTVLADHPGADEDGLIYDGKEFQIGEEALPTWYATNETKTARSLTVTPPAMVAYKGVVFSVSGIQEIYGPETRCILSFTNRHSPYPWGAPEREDLRNSQ